MKLKKEKPFENFDCYLNFNKGQGRWQVTMVDKNRNYKCYLYSKYIMSVSLGRILSSEEEVDHINGDKTDDRIENLQILTREENMNKWASENRAKNVIGSCCFCGKEFERSARNIRWKIKNNMNVYCSKHCQYMSMKK